MSGASSNASMSASSVPDLTEVSRREAIAQDALALLRAFVDRDLDEIVFRVTLVAHHAQQIGCPDLSGASAGLLREMSAETRSMDDGELPRALERVIAAAAKAVSTTDVPG